jgi:hypothetical protein
LTACREQKQGLEALGASRGRREADRARRCCLTLGGLSNRRIAEAFTIREETVRPWRIMRGGFEALRANIARSRCWLLEALSLTGLTGRSCISTRTCSPAIEGHEPQMPSSPPIATGENWMLGWRLWNNTSALRIIPQRASCQPAAGPGDAVLWSTTAEFRLLLGLDLARVLIGQGAVTAGIGVNLRPVERYRPQLQDTHLSRQDQNRDEQPLDLSQKPAPERGDRIVSVPFAMNRNATPS